MNPCEFKASLVYRVSFRTARVTQRSPVSKREKKNVTSLRIGCKYLILQKQMKLVSSKGHPGCLEGPVRAQDDYLSMSPTKSMDEPKSPSLLPVIA